jgi:nucleoside-diphosphate-sugar epimerase
MTDTGLDAVTGAFSYSGRAIAARLAEQGRRIRTLTGHPERAPEGSGVEVRPLDFDEPVELAESLRGVTTLYNTYWIRFARGRTDHDVAVANSRALFSAARRAGVRRIVHLSITNPSIESPFPYFRGKALVERALAETAESFAIVRPAVIYGGDGVLLNNIAWLLRRFPVFAVGGDGGYRLRPVHVDDLGRLCVRLGAESTDTVVDAVGPDRPTFRELVELISDAIGHRPAIVPVPPLAVPLLASVLGLAVSDVLLTRDEYFALAGGLADTDGEATGSTSLPAWLAANSAHLGTTYANELVRHFERGR